jgi:hypothetical protein
MPASEFSSRTPSPPPLATRGLAGPATSTSTGPSCASPQSDPEYWYVDFSDEMAAEEARPRLALIAQVGNASSPFSLADALTAISGATGLAADVLTVKVFFPESFLVCCATQTAHDRVLAASPIPLAITTLALRPWTSLAHADSKTLFLKIKLELVGIPPHAWNLTTVRKLLAPYWWVERLHDATARKYDLWEAVLTAWTEHPFVIPPSKKLRVAEREIPTVHSDPDSQRIFGNLSPYLRQKRTLIYNVDIHLRSITDFSPRTSSTSSSSLSDDGNSGPDGNLDLSYGFR